MTHKRISWLGAIFAVVIAGAAVGSDASDPGLANALSRVGSHFGWAVNYYPPGPCFPPGPCRATIVVDVDTQARTDLNQDVTFFHTVNGDSQPGVEILGNPPIGDFQGSTTVNILDGSQPVLVTVPAGFHLTPTNFGYVLSSGGSDLPPPE